MKRPFFVTNISTKRLTKITGKDNQDWQTCLASVDCNIQPLDSSYNEDLEGSYGKDYLMFCDVVDIIEGDKIISGSTEYIVKGVKSFEVINYSIMELTIRETQ